MLSSLLKEASHLQMNKTCGRTLCIWKLLLLYVGNYTAFDTLAVINNFFKKITGVVIPVTSPKGSLEPVRPTSE